MTQYEEHFVKYGDNKTIFYHATGPSLGPLIIFMHGWPGIGKTWYPQLDVFSSLGFRVIAPDMPGYGRSTARNVISDYSQESVIEGMLAVLGDTGRDQAIWVGHDWGCGTLWTLANTHPQVCKAAAGLCVPYGSVELGLDQLLTTVDRQLYPKDQYPYGQWSYMAYYEQFFDEATAWFNKGIHGFLKCMFVKSSADLIGKPSSLTSRVLEDKGWMGGRSSPPAPEDIPDEASIMNPAVFKELVSAMEKTGFGPADSWYMNHQANRRYNLEHSKHGGQLRMPVLFINCRYETVCTTVTSRLGSKMRENCLNLTETTIDAGHWVGQEKPQEVNSAIARWLVEEVIEQWPSFWSNGWTKQQLDQQ
ncbi:alpha beta-hydrolase [Trichoderma arundinaceum]|uniref:Alpha beta-hydrolase n=1 Tax=Trichoderma arundinaceum TaxID=490622 RepID=A0A395NSV4_TRIAR|nr:alpha beta-hydrolase [Trichoderma arundinaceum]